MGAIYHLNSERLSHAMDSELFLEADQKLRIAIDQLKSYLDAESILFKDEKRKERLKVLRSLKNHSSGLILFVDDSWIPMEYNTAELKLRNCVVGRKTYYGSRSIGSAQLFSEMSTIFQTLEMWGLNQKKYLDAY